MAPSSENPNQLPPPSGDEHSIQKESSFQRTIEAPPATVSVKAGTGVVTDIGDNQITERAEQIRYSTDEAMVWQETPSMALLVPRAVKYVIFLAVIFILCAEVNRYVPQIPAAHDFLAQNGVQASAPASSSSARSTHKKKSRHAATADDSTAPATATDSSTPAATDTPAVPEDPAQPQEKPLTLGRILFDVKAAFVVLYALLFALYFFRLKSTRYCASSQRLIVEEGAWHAVNKPYELHQLGDAVIVKPALLRMFNVSNLVITQPPIELKGLRNAEYVRDILRQGGQLEAQRADKIRFR
ncbi:MAG: PH domain-containing protein [Terracidiphilus sp.]|nr:PH domain-containing protein [Terracidiphilus sp.]